MKKSKKSRLFWIIGAAIVLLLVGGAFTMKQQSDARAESDRIAAVKREVKAKEEKAREKAAEPYQGLSSKTTDQVKAAEKAVTKAVNDRIAKKATAVIDTDVQVANDQINKIDNDDIKATFASIVKVISDSSITNLQDARTAIANLQDSHMSKHLAESYEKNLVQVVATNTKQSTTAVRNATKPLTPEQAKAKADKIAKAKADQLAAEKAKKDAAAQASANVQATQNAQQATTTQQSSTQTQAQSQPQTNAQQSNTQSTATGTTQQAQQPVQSTPQQSQAPTTTAPKQTAPARNNNAQKAASHAQTSSQSSQNNGTKTPWAGTEGDAESLGHMSYGW